ncbi:MAG: MSMEG_4193 family putative phosphomutase [Chloroflexota bacterium]|nr:MAG: MSMEG_4193 family putative phosphomutase [Chloroflexota bacterium]
MAYALLIRHAQNDWVSKNRLAGWTPGVHLNDAGRKQAEQLGDRLSKLPLKAIYSSPLERCLETAETVAAAHDLEITLLDAVGEVRYGKWEGKKIKKLSKKRSWHAVQHFPSRFRFPEGESFLEVQQRAVTAIESLSRRHKKEMIAIVSHADVIKLVLAHYLGTHIDLFQRIAVSTASVSLLALPESGSVRALRINDHGPIEPPPPPKERNEDSEKTRDTTAGEENVAPELATTPDGGKPGGPVSFSKTEAMT